MTSVHLTGDDDPKFVFNIAAGVGRNRPNRRLDVMLVQYLLSIVTQIEVERLPNLRRSTNTSIVPPEYKDQLFSVDGICGPKTMRYIEYYQQFRSSHRQESLDSDYDFQIKLKADGAVDRWAFPCVMKKSYTYSDDPIPASSTLQSLNYDANWNNLHNGKIDTMPMELRRVLASK
jgi:hypothetical protein